MSLVDMSATARWLTDQELHSWANEQRVFISSVMEDLANERRAVANTVQRMGAEPVWFEAFGGRDDDPTKAYLSEVASSTIYVGILDRNYGSLQSSRRSATHEEYRAAERYGVRVSVWIREGIELQGDQQDFVDEIRTFHTTGRFSGPDDLAQGVETRLKRIAAEDVSPWVKLDDVVFRARRIQDEGKRIHVKAAIHDPQVLGLLEAMRGSAWYGPKETTLTYGGRTSPVRIKAVTINTEALHAPEAEIDLRVDDLPDPLLGALTVGLRTYSADDLTEAALRKVLFGEPMPAMLVSFGGSLQDPLANLPEQPLSEEALRPILRLLLTEVLVGSGRASRLTRFQLSSPADGQRRLILGWQGRGTAGQAGQVRETEGQVQLP